MEQPDLTRLYKINNNPIMPEITNARPAQYVALTGKGEPAGDAFLEKIKALYATVYAIKFRWKRAGKDFVIPKLEVFQYHEEKTDGKDKGYRLLIWLPEYVTEQDVQKGIASVVANMNIQLADHIKFYGMRDIHPADSHRARYL